MPEPANVEERHVRRRLDLAEGARAIAFHARDLGAELREERRQAR